MKHKRTFWLLAIPLLAAGVFIFTQSAAVYAKGLSGSHNHDDQDTNHGQMMANHHGANWQNHHQQMHGSDRKP